LDHERTAEVQTEAGSERASSPEGRVSRVGGTIAEFRQQLDFTAATPTLRQPEDAGLVDQALRLQEISTLLIQENNVDALYAQVLDAAITLMSADMGSMQILDPERGELRLLAWKGFHPESAAFWEWVRIDAASTCGLALASGTRIVVPDTETCEFMAGTADLDSSRLSGIRAVQSTPLLSRSGRLLGMISTHWRQPHQPTERALRPLDVLARQAADLIERSLTETALRASEERFRRLAAIVETTDDAVISFALDGIVTTWNRGAERLYSYTAGEMVGRPITSIIPPNRLDDEDSIITRIKRGERVDSYDTVRARKDGSLVHVSLTASPIKDNAGRVIGASKIARDITERKQAEEQIQLLLGEVDHRARNLLAVIQAVVHMSQGRTPRELKAAIEARIQALSNVHTLLAESRWAGAHLSSLVKNELLPYCSEEMLRTNISGPDLLLGSSQAQPLAMMFHELATNAVKYGALSVSAGCVQVDWSRGEDGRLLLRWTEAGGPPTEPPKQEGFGMQLLKQLVHEQLSGEIRLDWRAEGLACEITF
jgi:PAS domain S-box-containing protein